MIQATHTFISTSIMPKSEIHDYQLCRTIYKLEVSYYLHKFITFV